MNSITFINRHLSENFLSDWFQISVKPPIKTLLQLYWDNLSGTKTGALKIYGSIDGVVMSLIANVDLNVPSSQNDALAVSVEAPYKYFRFAYEKGNVDARARLSIICSAQV